ncbi:MAG TPA: cupin domain-containing protein [Candidatus Binatia bacterium]|nr:cupin domain-containing protein [Candidatus Binatia bacterium]
MSEQSPHATGKDGPAVSQARRVDKPWGYELIWAHAERYVGKILHIDAGHALSYQFHQKKEETIYVLSGTLRLHYSLDESAPNVIDLPPGSVFHIRPGLRHRFEAQADVDLLEASTPELDDVVRLEDRYGRTPP